MFRLPLRYLVTPSANGAVTDNAALQRSTSSFPGNQGVNALNLRQGDGPAAILWKLFKLGQDSTGAGQDPDGMRSLFMSHESVYCESFYTLAET